MVSALDYTPIYHVLLDVKLFKLISYNFFLFINNSAKSALLHIFNPLLRFHLLISIGIIHKFLLNFGFICLLLALQIFFFIIILVLLIFHLHYVDFHYLFLRHFLFSLLFIELGYLELFLLFFLSYFLILL
jgi:hypothetical protein